MKIRRTFCNYLKLNNESKPSYLYRQLVAKCCKEFLRENQEVRIPSPFSKGLKRVKHFDLKFNDFNLFLYWRNLY